MIKLLEQNGANLFMKDGEGYSGLQLATMLNKNEIVANLNRAIIKQKSELLLKWSNVFQNKPILMSELKRHIENTDVVSYNLSTYLNFLKGLLTHYIYKRRGVLTGCLTLKCVIVNGSEG